ncbi:MULTISPECIES: phosphotransferase family protein [Halorubrum]|uniref:Predicted kinase, aminoglycoside phosphotransferase (APT) family n=1 Tax=Halorubrum sodomense TaxID=35743 RepID=A0A1I6GT70_HALSD|nr:MULTISPECIES: aminoglycoside phosphotransferase family protein [Halorubrum]TKX54699.1 aminoglycoside phosphotransferase family protein [Halorubrum sp. SP3]TKX70177.1 aminoglycoside phosphotransferase family protein [Halorubrum sp. SP9]SFR45435.1 Predicted kinase, aminoglycoside phosphotransferase (APT) family [Halorubrum sodomense]
MDGGESTAIPRALTEAFPDRAVDRLTGVGPSWNGANETVGVVFTDGSRAFLKVALADESRRLARERAVLRYLRAHGPVPVPEVLAADPDGDPAYLATAPAPGEGLLEVYEAASDRERERLLRRVGAAIAALHADRFASHGEIVGAGSGSGTEGGADADPIEGSDPPSGLAIETAPWTDVLLATIDRTREIGTSERLAEHYDAVIDCVHANRDLLDGAPAALLHGDVTKPNLFVAAEGDGADARGASNGNAPGVAMIDWELSHVGDPARDLVRAEDQLLNGFDSTGPERFAAALRAGYRDRAGGLPEGFERRRPVYEVVRMLGRSGFIDQWATYLDEPLDFLVERADAELRARLDAV